MKGSIRRVVVAVAAVSTWPVLLGTGCRGEQPPPTEAGPQKTQPASREPAPPSLLENASFEASGEGLPGWTTDVGAHHASGGKTSSVLVDREVGAAGAASLRLSGDLSVMRWLAVWQDVKAALPAHGEVSVAFAGRTLGVRQQGSQYPNKNGLVAFFDAGGKRLSLVASELLPGDPGWHRLTLRAEIPAGAVRARVGFLLSMTGSMWIDDVSVRVRAVTPWKREASAEVFDYLVERVAAMYPFADVTKDLRAWRQHADELRAGAVASPTRDAFAAALVELLAWLKDPHVAVRVEGEPKPTVPAQELPEPWNFEVLKERVEARLMGGGEFAVVLLRGGIGYVAIGSWQRGSQPIDRVLEAMEGLADVRGLIIDVRTNQGGDEQQAQRVASRFARERVVYARHRYRRGDGYGPWHERTIGPNPEADGRPVVVLQSPWCMSSSEGFLQAMRVLPHVTTVGLPSRGASRNPAVVRLTSDVDALISRWENTLPDGTPTEHRGVPPEVPVTAAPDAYQDADPMLERAFELLSAAAPPAKPTP